MQIMEECEEDVDMGGMFMDDCDDYGEEVYRSSSPIYAKGSQPEAARN